MTTLNFINISEMCIQRSRRQHLVPPPPRLEVVSPYPQYTALQLNMRRKTEILKHDTNNSKTKRLTKAERFAQLIQGSTQRRTYTNQQLVDIAEGRRQTCPANDLLPTLTSSCDVPGPIEVLQYDPTIPLYNYEGVLNYAFSENNLNPDQALFLVFPNNQPVRVVSNEMTDIVGTLFINNTSFNNSYNFNISTQITNESTLGAGSLTQVYMYIYYNKVLVTTNDPNQKFSSNVIPKVINPLGGGGTIQATVSLYGRPGFIYDVRFKMVGLESALFHDFKCY